MMDNSFFYPNLIKEDSESTQVQKEEEAEEPRWKQIPSRK